MAFENATHINELNASSPTTVDDPWGTNAIYLEFQQLKTVLTTDFASIAGAVTATHTELNYCDITTLGTAQASKALTVDASDNVDASAVTWTNLGEVTTVDINGGTIDGVTINGAVGGGTPAAGDFTTLSASSTLAVTGAATFDGNVTLGDAATDTVTITADVASDVIPSADDTYDLGASGSEWKDLYVDGTAYVDAVSGAAIDSSTIGQSTPGAGAFTTLQATGTAGYTTGAGGSVTQATSRTTGVTVNAACGAITLVSAAGSASWATFTVTNSDVAATDVIILNQQTGANLYLLHVTNIQAGQFDITFATTAGTTTEQPIFNFSVVKGVTS